MGAVVGHHRAFRTGIRFLQGLNIRLGHVDRAEDKIHPGGDVLHLGGVQYRQEYADCPAWLPPSSSVRPPPPRTFSRRSERWRPDRHLKPRMSMEQQGKTLSHHPRAADNTDAICFHMIHPFTPDNE